MDAIQLIKKDHATVERLFKQFERAEDRDRKSDQRRIVRALIKELSVHATIEELLLYPALRRADEDAEDDVLEALEEHHLVKLTLDELDGMSPDDERWCAKVTVLIEGVRHHVEEEEDELLPELKKALGANQLRELGGLLAQAKRTAPTRPHPAAPDTPPGNILAGAVAALFDRGRDALRGIAGRGAEAGKSVAQRGREALSDTASMGSSMAKDAARRGRAAARRKIAGSSRAGKRGGGRRPGSRRAGEHPPMVH